MTVLYQLKSAYFIFLRIMVKKKGTSVKYFIRCWPSGGKSEPFCGKMNNSQLSVLFFLMLYIALSYVHAFAKLYFTQDLQRISGVHYIYSLMFLQIHI